MSLDAYQIMGIERYKTPSDSYFPASLSNQAKALWKEMIHDVNVKNEIKSTSGLTEKWEKALELVHDRFKKKHSTMDFFDPGIFSNASRNLLTSNLSARRAVMRKRVDNSRGLEGIEFHRHKVTHFIYFDGKRLQLKTKAHVNEEDLNKSSWLKELDKEKGFMVYGRKYKIPNMPKDMEAGFDAKTRIKFYTKIKMASKYVPEEAFTPFLDVDIYERYMLKHIWTPRIRQYPFKTLQRKHKHLII